MSQIWLHASAFSLYSSWVCIQHQPTSSVYATVSCKDQSYALYSTRCIQERDGHTAHTPNLCYEVFLVSLHVWLTILLLNSVKIRHYRFLSSCIPKLPETLLSPQDNAKIDDSEHCSRAELLGLLVPSSTSISRQRQYDQHTLHINISPTIKVVLTVVDTAARREIPIPHRSLLPSHKHHPPCVQSGRRSHTSQTLKVVPRLPLLCGRTGKPLPPNVPNIAHHGLLPL